MSTKKLQILSIVIWMGAALLILGVLVSYPLYASYLPDLFESETATPVKVITPTPLPDPPLFILPPTPVVTYFGAMTSTQMVTSTEGEVLYFDTLEVLGTPTPLWSGATPTRLIIPDIQLDVPVVPITWNSITLNGVSQAIWSVPDWRAAGWHETSSKVGIAGNTVFNGHNTTKGEVFRDLYLLEPGAQVLVETEDATTYTYIISDKLILPEAGQPLEVRIENARYVQPTQDERLTMVTCHPYGSLANRLIIIAYPVPNAQAGLNEGD